MHSSISSRAENSQDTGSYWHTHVDKAKDRSYVVVCLTNTLLAYLSVAIGTLAGVCPKRVNAVLTWLAVMQVQFTLIYICKIMCTNIMYDLTEIM